MTKLNYDADIDPSPLDGQTVAVGGPVMLRERYLEVPAELARRVEGIVPTATVEALRAA